MSKSGIPIVSDIAKGIGSVAKALKPIAPILPFIPIPGMFGLSSLLTKSLLTGALGGVGRGCVLRVHATAPERLRCQACKPLINSSMKNAAQSITTATAVAPA